MKVFNYRKMISDIGTMILNLTDTLISGGIDDGSINAPTDNEEYIQAMQETCSHLSMARNTLGKAKDLDIHAETNYILKGLIEQLFEGEDVAGVSIVDADDVIVNLSPPSIIKEEEDEEA